MPPQEYDNKYQHLQKELPQETEALAKQCHAFTRARQIKSAAELLYILFLYCIAELSAREIAGVCAGSGKRISDEAVRQRLAACPQWLEALLGRMLPQGKLPHREDRAWRIVICDGSQISGPGATGTDWRWHICYDPVAQQVCDLQLSDVHTNESLTLFELGAGDLVLGDRHFAKATALVAVRKLGAHVVVRMTPQLLKLSTTDGGSFDLLAALRAAADRTRLSFAVQVRDTRSGVTIPVWIDAHHLDAQQIARARRRVKRKAQRNSHTPREQTLFLAEWVVLDDNCARRVERRGDSGVVRCALASGVGHQTLQEFAQC